MKCLLILVFLVSCAKNESKLQNQKVMSKPKPTVNNPTIPEEAGTEEIILTANDENGWYYPHLFTKDEEVIPLGEGDEWTEGYNAFFLNGKYHFGSYDNSNGNLDWTDTMMVSVSLDDPSDAVRAFDINGENSDDGISYESNVLRNGKIWFLANWGSELYSWDGISENPTFISDYNRNSRAKEIRNFGDYIYFRNGDNIISRLDTRDSSLESVDFSDYTNTLIDYNFSYIEDIHPQTGELLIHVSLRDQFNEKTFFYVLYDPTEEIDSNNPYIVMELDSESSSSAGIDDNTIFIINSDCTSQCPTEMIAHDIPTKTNRIIARRDNTSNTQYVSVKTGNTLDKNILHKNGSKYYLRFIDEDWDYGLVFEYDSHTKLSRQVLSNDSFGRIYSSFDVHGNTYLITGGKTEFQRIYRTDFNNLTLLRNGEAETTFKLNNKLYTIANDQGDDVNENLKLYRVESDDSFTLIHDFTKDGSDPEVWSDPDARIILK